jgi:hypothetical protein
VSQGRSAASSPWGLGQQHHSTEGAQSRAWQRQLCLRDVNLGIHARGRIENRHQNRECDEQEQRDERDYDYYGPYYDQPHRQCSPEEGHIPGCVMAYSRDLKQVR